MVKPVRKPLYRPSYSGIYSAYGHALYPYGLPPRICNTYTFFNAKFSPYLLTTRTYRSDFLTIQPDFQQYDVLNFVHIPLDTYFV